MELHRRDLQRDVQELGELLGEVVRSQESEETYELVEDIRRSAIANREGGKGAELPESLPHYFSDLSADESLIVARAFTTYFELINLAEERERVRALRKASQSDIPEDGLEAVADTLAASDEDIIQQVLADVLIQPTFTAHPTEARRKTVKAKLRSVADNIETLDEKLLTDKEETQITRRLRSEITSLWQTRQVRERQPEPFDEALNVQWYLENVLFDVIDEIYDEFEQVLNARIDVDELKIPKLFEFRSWAGSDRDGNPFVTPDVTRQTLERQREVALDRYREEIKRLSGALSQDGKRLSLGSEVSNALSENKNRFPAAAEAAEERYPNEPYRQQLKLMRERLDRVDDPRSGGYQDSGKFLDDLESIAEDLRANNGEDIAYTYVNPLIRKVETFGFSLASLDLRDHQENHTEAIIEVLQRQGTDYSAMDEAERVEFLTQVIKADEPILDLKNTNGLTETATRVFTRFDELANWQSEFGTDAIDTYCISMCEEPSHVLEVLFLADQADVVNLPEKCGLDIVPLLETEYALSGARRIMGKIFDNEAYSTALESRGNLQEIMLGYSDSNKENGYLAARWSLYRNQKRLADICADYDVEMRLFHGRGGSISRGGGPMNDALLALPNESVTGQVKFTEQGESIAEKYANPSIAERELEQMLNAQVRARLDALQTPTEPVKDEWMTAMEIAAEAAREEYQDLLDTKGFVSYFEQATPITVIEDLNLGSRPASRSENRAIEDLRAIPWVFSWTQSRCILPGWYSLASGLNAYLDEGGEVETLQEMYQEWPFFRTMLDNAALALARTDMEIAQSYADLADEDLRERFFPRLQSEYDRAVGLVESISPDDTHPIRPWLKKSLNRRNPYVDPLNHVQMKLLDLEDRSEIEEQTIRLTIKGIAAGMKNTG